MKTYSIWLRAAAVVQIVSFKKCRGSFWLPDHVCPGKADPAGTSRGPYVIRHPYAES